MQALILTGLRRSATVASFTDGFARVTNDDSLLAGSAQSEGRTCLVPRPPTPRSFVSGHVARAVRLDTSPKIN